MNFVVHERGGHRQHNHTHAHTKEADGRGERELGECKEWGRDEGIH
jgi:hypothetical protein